MAASQTVVDLLFQASSENSLSKLQIAKNTYSIIELWTGLAQRNEEGETPLVVAMKRKNVSVISELVTWMSKNHVYSEEDHKPMYMIVINQLSQHIPIVELMDYLIKDLDYEGWMEYIGHLFIKSTSFTRLDKIIALELTGAFLVMIDNFNNLGRFFMGMNYWKIAMNLRYSPQHGEAFLPKTSYVYIPSEASSVVFGSTVEITSIEELELLQLNVIRNFMTDQLLYIKRTQIQALLVIRRISVQANHEHPRWLYPKSLLTFILNALAQRNSPVLGEIIKIVINTSLLILEQTTGFDPKIMFVSPNVFIKTLWIMSTFLIVTLLKTPPNSPVREEISYANLLAPTKFITTIDCDHFENYEDRLHFVELVYRFLFVLDSISPQMTNEEKQKLEEYYSNFIRNLSPERTTTILHVAVSGRNISRTENYDISPQMIKLILKLGGDPNAMDEKGRTPLHILAGVKFLHLDEYVHAFKALVNAETHLDATSDDGDTVLSILKKTWMEYGIGEQIAHPYFESLINSVFPLSCYAARVIRRSGIRFDEDRLPIHLQELVARHSAKEITD